jgi:replicative DNA helicase
MNEQAGGGMPGDVISIVGRPARGKTFLGLHIAMDNWVGKKLNTLFVSPEMGLLPILQRVSSMYTHTPLTQLKQASFSGVTYQKFKESIKGFQNEQAKFYIVDGNLASTVDDVFLLADQFECVVIVIDGAYLLKHQNAKLDRFTRVAENCELMKYYSGEQKKCTFASWQLNREATKKSKSGKKQEVGLEDIGMSDAIPQISSIVLGLLEEEGVETLLKRRVKVMKGRDGQIGGFEINWDFTKMDFGEVLLKKATEDQPDLQFI